MKKSDYYDPYEAIGKKRREKKPDKRTHPPRAQAHRLNYLGKAGIFPTKEKE